MQPNKEQQLQFVTDLLESGTLTSVQRLVSALHPAEIAHLLESLRPGDREVIWKLVPGEFVGEVLMELNDEVRTGLIEATDDNALINAADTLESDDLVDFLKDVPEVILNTVLESMGQQDRTRLERVLSYDDDCAGGLMSLDTLSIRSDVNLNVVIRYLRLKGEIPKSTDKIIVVDREDNFKGVLPLTILLTYDGGERVEDLMIKDNVDVIQVQMPVEDIALLFEEHNLVSAPVLSEAGKLLGRITIDDVVDVIRDESDHSFMSMVGLDEEQDMFAPVLLSAKRRALWLGVNLCTALLASWVIGIFEMTVDKIVVLAILMPIVASMGGIAGSQTLTLFIRGLALRQIGSANVNSLIIKELAIGLINGVVWAFVVGCIVWLWFDNVSIGILIAVALMINLVFAALAGASIPMVLQRLNIDPALAGGVILTTVTDVLGFFVFLGLATVYLV
ncbi:MAG TPA: magnesium transporter [Methylococcales bacterium]|jgi:magnesium transporter|nr:magnesium transporter [Methylococcales bacterium]